MWSRIATNLDAWAVLGLAAQAAFTGRFLVQWIASERTGRSVIPVAFWYLSLFGSAGLLLYAIGRADPVFILGQSFGSVVYIRNLALIRRERRRTQPAPANPQQNSHPQTVI